MLFPLSPDTPRCVVFEILNMEVLVFLEASVEATAFVEDLFSEYQHANKIVRSACWTNQPTKDKFEAVWKALPLERDARQGLFEMVSNAQEIECFFSDTSIAVPELRGGDLFDALKSLTSHLFTNTKGLSGIKEQAHGSIEQHFQQYKTANHDTQLCYLCGTATLSQDRSGIEAEEQWRADYDHILCKDKYPIYSVHPGNFIPTCHICNSKSKGAKDLLFCADKKRRTAFYPLPPANESCFQYASVVPDFRTLEELTNGKWQDPMFAAKVVFSGTPADVLSKVEVWIAVYQVPERVEAHIIANFCDRLISDLRPQNFNDFCCQLRRHAGSPPLDYKKAEWRFWWEKIYAYLNSQNNRKLNDIWALIQWKLENTNDADMRETFGILSMASLSEVKTAFFGHIM